LEINPFVPFGEGPKIRTIDPNGNPFDVYYQLESNKQLSPGCILNIFSYPEPAIVVYDPSEDIYKSLEEAKKTKFVDHQSGLTNLQLIDRLGSNKFEIRRKAREELKTSNYPTLLYCIEHWDNEVVWAGTVEFNRRIQEAGQNSIRKWKAQANQKNLKGGIKTIKVIFSNWLGQKD
jgi:hypothetical protein